MKLIEVLDDHDDVQNVYGNYELSDALMAQAGWLRRGLSARRGRCADLSAVPGT